MSLNKIKCIHKFIKETRTCEKVCLKCGLVGDVEMVYTFNEEFYQNDFYRPREYVKNQIKMLNGIGLNFDDYENVRQYILSLLPNKFTWTQAHRLLDIGPNIHFIMIPYILGHPVYISEMDKEMAIRLRYLDGRPLKVLFIWFKLAQLRNPEEAKWVPLKACPLTLRKYDSEWKKVCKEYGFRYIRTSKEIEVNISNLRVENKILEYKCHSGGDYEKGCVCWECNVMRNNENYDMYRYGKKLNQIG